MRLFSGLLAAAFCATAVAANAAQTQVQLLLSAGNARGGDTILAGVDMKMAEGWHTYWKNPGDAGMATKIEWQLPPGISAGAIKWPLPEKLPPIEVTTYGYENEVVLVVPLKLATNLPAGPVKIAANISWLECKESCVPADASVEARINIGSETTASSDAAMIQSWLSKVPSPAAPDSWRGAAWWEKSEAANKRTLMIEGTATLKTPWNTNDRADFFPDASDTYEILGPTKMLPAQNNECSFLLRKSVQKFSGNWPKEISGVMVQESDEGPRTAFEVRLAVAGEEPEDASASATPVQGASSPPQPLGQMLLFAFVGGLILNLMPCVLPVIALKILGFVSEAQSEPRRVRKLGLIYALGVLLSFLALAAVVIGVKTAGHHAGWGMQFGSPIFVTCLTVLVTLVALNLFGVFEVALGGGAWNAAGNLAARRGASGAFFNGVLATTLATPCTAPFLAPALGFAFSQSSAIIILIFLVVGLGLASPYVLLSWHPAWLKFLPKPGAWMEKFKIAMGFPMLATVVWLFNIAASSYGKNVLWLGIFLVVVALAAWIFGEFFQRGRKHQAAAAIITLMLLGGGYVFALEKELDWRTAMPDTGSTGSLKESADGIDWQPWSPEAVAAARAAGKPVLVDFTADWCLTCQVNKKIAIDIPSVRTKLQSINAVALLGDYTHFPDGITVELQRYQRAGVPLVLVYPRNAQAAPIVLPEVLTPGIVLNALNQAAE